MFAFKDVQGTFKILMSILISEKEKICKQFCYYNQTKAPFFELSPQLRDTGLLSSDIKFRYLNVDL